MRRQRNMVQMKEQNKTPEKELNEMERSHLSDAEFKELNSIKKVQSETKGTLIEIKNNWQGNNSRFMDETENQINDLQHKEAKKTIRTTRRKKNPKK